MYQVNKIHSPVPHRHQRIYYEDDPLESLQPGPLYHSKICINHRSLIHQQLIDEIARLPGKKIVNWETTRLFVNFQMRGDQFVDSDSEDIKTQLQNIWLMNTGVIFIGIIDERERTIQFKGIETKKHANNNYKEEFEYMKSDNVKHYVSRDPLWMSYSEKYKFLY